jgi:HlyD family secretion protein
MKQKKLIRIIIIIAVVLIVFVIIAKSLGWVGKGIIYNVNTEKPVKRTITETITANGKIQPQTEIKISSDVSGEIVELNVKEGDEVKKGDLLIKINPDIYMSSLERMKAALNSSRANYANSKARLLQVEAQFTQQELSYKRNKKLWDQKAISQADFETAQAGYDGAKANLESAKQDVKAAEYTVQSSEASLKEANENLTKTSIFAPIGGTVSKLNVELGERVVGTAQFSGTEMLRIANLNKMEVKVDVNENDIIRVKLGDTSQIEVDAYLNRKFKGIVSEIANSATTTSASTTDQVTSFEVKISILPESYKDLIPRDNPDYYPFRPGMSASLEIMTCTSKNILTVPIQSVTTRTDSIKPNRNVKHGKDTVEILPSKEIIFIYSNGMALSREVKTGIQDNNYIEILSGITLNDEIIVSPYSIISKKLKDKMKVKKVEKDQLFNKEEN